MKHFNDCRNIEELRTKYKELAKLYHPDLAGGDGEEMKLVNAEYELSILRLENSTRGSENEVKWNFEKEYAEVLVKIINLKNITIELVGAWVWVTGETIPVKEILKKAGFWFAGQKKAWYWRPSYARCYFSKGKKSLNTIRYEYGSRKINTEEAIAIPA